MKFIYVLALILLTGSRLLAQTNGYQVGQSIENFTLPLVAGDKVVVVVFTNKSCPYSRLYEKRLQKLASEYSGKGAKFLFLSPAIGMEPGNKVSDASGSGLPYITDTDQRMSRQFGATKTPESFVLQLINSTYILRYKGAIDDNPQLETGVKETYLKNALDDVLTNQRPAITEKRATGCMIKRL